MFHKRPAVDSVKSDEMNGLTPSAIDVVPVDTLSKAFGVLETDAYQDTLKSFDGMGKYFKPIVMFIRKKNMAILQTIVNIWVEQTAPLLSIGLMIRDMRDLQRRSQAMASASEEMAASVREVAHTTDLVSQDASAVRHELAGSVQSVNEAFQTMDGITTAFNSIEEKVHVLEKASEQIAQILKTIEKIASQTNLLALNATIEAARAGEAGKGFAVVASEVKNLAKQTAGATEDIRGRIALLQQGMTDMLSSMNDGSAHVAQGTNVIKVVGDNIHTVGERIEDVVQKMVEVSSTVQEQSAVTADVAQNIASIAKMADTTLSGIDGLTTSIENASKIVQTELGQIVKNPDAAMLVLVTKADHASFKKRVIDTIIGHGTTKSTDLPDNHHCRLGVWYDSFKGEEIRSLPEFKKLDDPHHRVHAHGRASLANYENDDFAGALVEARKMDEASHEVIEILDALYRKIDVKQQGQG